MKQIKFLLINPPIYDFSAYDLWLKPLGLLTIASALKNTGAHVSLLDCLDRNHPGGKDQIPGLPHRARPQKWGCGHYLVAKVEKPPALKALPRLYKRYGISPQALKDSLLRTGPVDAILVTSGMTYWYPGVQEVIAAVRGQYTSAPVLLGGIYATLCTDHARRFSGADRVIAGGRIADLFSALTSLGLGADEKQAPAEFPSYPPPAYELYPLLDSAAIRTTRGCPFSCTYCAVHALSGTGWERKQPSIAAAEIRQLYSRGIRDIAFYDDALLAQAESHIIPLLEEVAATCPGTRLHTPNGLHARYLSRPIANLMKRSGFTIPLISLETAMPQAQENTGGKVSNEHFISACENLKAEGYRKGEYATYLLAGIPGQEPEEVEGSIHFAHSQGAKVSLAEYSPLPGTRDWDTAKVMLPGDDPLWHNNSLFPAYCLPKWQKLQRLKVLARSLNSRF